MFKFKNRICASILIAALSIPIFIPMNTKAESIIDLNPGTEESTTEAEYEKNIPVNTKKHKQYVITIIGEGSNNFDITYDFDQEPIEVKADGRQIIMPWKATGTIYVTARKGYTLGLPSKEKGLHKSYIKSVYNIMQDNPYLEEEKKIQRKNCVVNYNSASFFRCPASSIDGTLGYFSCKCYQYKINITESSFKAYNPLLPRSGGIIKGYTQNAENFTFYVGVFDENALPYSKFTGSYDAGDPRKGKDKKKDDDRRKVAKYEDDVDDTTNWENAIAALGDFQEIIRFITNAFFIGGILFSTICLILNIYQLSIVSTHPIQRRATTINIITSITCFGIFGAIKLFATLLIQLILTG